MRLLALSPGTVADAVRLLAVAWPGRPVRSAAALLASGHSPGDLAGALGAADPNELRACLLHELALRGARPSRSPGPASRGGPSTRSPGCPRRSLRWRAAPRSPATA
nr:hypothetical protein GCM10020063_004980 [Dactylosporangium thailandense]